MGLLSSIEDLFLYIRTTVIMRISIVLDCPSPLISASSTHREWASVSPNSAASTVSDETSTAAAVSETPITATDLSVYTPDISLATISIPVADIQRLAVGEEVWVGSIEEIGWLL